MKTLTALFTGLILTGSARAQWRSTVYVLKPGWSGIYLPGDATYLTPEEHFASQPDVVEIWRWNPNPDQAQFSASPSQPSQGTPEWSVWRRGQPGLSDLTLLTGQSSYLVKLKDGAVQQPLTVKQRVIPPSVQWLRAGGNLLGFPTRKAGAQFPGYTTYFAAFPPATSSRIYRYNGGPLDTNNPVRIFSPAAERVDATQAYWFEAKTVSRFMGPLDFEVSDPQGLHFGQAASSITVRVRNNTPAAQTLTFAAENSETPPPGQPPIAGPVALTRRTFNTSTARYEDTPVTAPFSVSLNAGGTAELMFGVDRTVMNGAPGALFASLLRATDAANMMDVYLPVTAGSASLAGLWAGDAELNQVESKVPGFSGTRTSRSLPLRYLIHVDGQGRAALLSQVFIGILDGPGEVTGVTTAEAKLAAATKRHAVRLTAAHLPLDRIILGAGSFSAGGTLTGTINLPYNDPVNPFVHQYHPDHDNLTARFAPLSAGKESYTVNRAVTFTFATAPPPALQLNGRWGSRILSGTYTETITGIHREPITATGTFTLRRVSETPVLTMP